MQNFNEAGLPLPLMRSLERMGFVTPTPIQAQAIPHALAGRDVLGTAQTGTGKTAAFGIPLACKLLSNPRGSALILLPTRELAVQVMEALEQLLADSRIPSALLIGGESMPKQFEQLRKRPRLIVGTPGRINDHLQRGTLMLHDVQFLVLDETDRMLDMGFGVQLEAIAKYLTAKRQTLMFSATLPAEIVKLAGKYLQDPVRISIGSTTATATKVTQEHVRVSDEEKYPRLLSELENRSGSVIVFVKTKWGAEKLANRLRKEKHRADALHGDLRQNQRERVIDAFREQKYRILVATDIAARGLDIPHIEHVINYDLPHSPEDYIHRIGPYGTRRGGRCSA
jgi:ATP-dependent RNA helicase DeaD